MNFADKIPYKKSTEIPAVGNSPNASVSASRLGLKSALVTNIGNDENGHKCLNSLIKNGVITKFVETCKNYKTNYHFVLSFKSDRTILVKHTEFDYKLPDIGKPKWIYLSSLAENSLPYQLEIAKYLETNPDVKMAFQPGTFQIELGYEKLKKIYKASELFFLQCRRSKKDIKAVRKRC